MRRTHLTRSLTAMAVGAALTVGFAPAASSAPAAPGVPELQEPRQPDVALGPLAAKQQDKLETAAKLRLEKGEQASEARGFSAAGPNTVKLGQWDSVQLPRDRTDNMFVILAEFGDKVDPKYGGTPGPLHNQIPKPDPKTDNHTYWEKDFSKNFFQKMYFDTSSGANSMANYFNSQSSGRYGIKGEVTDWVKVPYNEARYGNDDCGMACTSNLIGDALEAYVAGEKAKGRTASEIKAALAKYDVWDRYDFDRDGNYEEPDGYLDRFQIVHAGIDGTWGGGAQGADAVWAHRSNAFTSGFGKTGPEFNRQGGAPVGDTGLWVNDYVTGGENSGVGLFAHEFGHDLGLPDEYSTGVKSGDNSTGFWTLMSSGSYMGEANGRLPGAMNAWDKFQLGWLDYDKAKAGTDSLHLLGPGSFANWGKQAVIVDLPKKKVTRTVTTPVQGKQMWWSSKHDNLNATLTRGIDLTGKSSASLKLKTWFHTEVACDFVYAEVSTDGGGTWSYLDGTLNGAPLERTADGIPALNGQSAGWVDVAYPLDAYAGQDIKFRFRATSDTGVNKTGFAADVVSVVADGTVLFTDDAEGGDNGWTADGGFQRITGQWDELQPMAYFVENRRYLAYDERLKYGPYNYGNWGVPGKQDITERFAYQDGVLISLYDGTYSGSYSDNSTPDHPGEGQILPIDANPGPLKWGDGALMNGRIQTFDATFTAGRYDALTLHKAGVPTTIPARKGVSSFNDRTGKYWVPELPNNGVKVPDTNTRIDVTAELLDGRYTLIRVRPAG